MTSTSLDPWSPGVDGPAVSCRPAALSQAEKTVAVTRVRYLERQLFDDGGLVRKGTTGVRADEIVGMINELRRALGWLEIDLDARWRRPANANAKSASRRRVA